MPHELCRDYTGDLTALWWYDASTVEKEIDQFPWLQRPVLEQPADTDVPPPLANPTYTGELCFHCRHIDICWFTRLESEYEYILIDGQEVQIIALSLQLITVTDAKRGRQTGCPVCAISLHLLQNGNGVDDIGEYVEDDSDGVESQWLSWLPRFARRVKRFPTWITVATPSSSFMSLRLSVRTEHQVIYNDYSENYSSSQLYEPLRSLKMDHFTPVPGGSTAFVDLSIARDYINQCLSQGQGHEVCMTGPSVRGASQQTYFIDVTRGCVQAGSTSDREYLALSYVWGSTESIELTTTTLIELETPGSLRELSPKIPATITDAMMVCRELGYRFLWVDRLCIVQNSPSKQKVISNMHIIYAGAVATIVAGAGDDANAGLAGLRPGSRMLAQPTALLKTGTCLAAQIESGPGLSKSVWNTRGWTFQEEYCSQRIVAFGPDQMYLECPHFRSSEIDLLNSNSKSWMRDTSRHSSAGKDMIKEYCKITSSYTARMLTHDYDIYNAYAGLLGMFARNLSNPTFISAMPAAFLDVALLFRVDEDGCRRRSTIDERSRSSSWPSWAWLGWTGKIWFLNEENYGERQIPRVQWIPDQKALPLVDDILLVQPSINTDRITPEELEAEDRRASFDASRYGRHSPTFSDIMLTELHLRADVAFFQVGERDLTRAGRFQVLDQDGVACGVVYSHLDISGTFYRFIKIALGRAETVKLIQQEGDLENALPHYDEVRYPDGERKFKIYKVLVVDEREERIGSGSVHVNAFDAACERGVDIVLR